MLFYDQILKYSQQIDEGKFISLQFNPYFRNETGKEKEKKIKKKSNNAMSSPLRKHAYLNILKI